MANDVAAAGFVDATGDAALAWNAGLACREAADGPIYGTQMVVIEGIEEAHQPERPEVAERLTEGEGLRPDARERFRVRVSRQEHRARQHDPCRDAA